MDLLEFTVQTWPPFAIHFAQEMLRALFGFASTSIRYAWRNNIQEHAWAVVLDAEIDQLGPLFEKTPCHRELLDALDLGQGSDRR